MNYTLLCRIEFKTKKQLVPPMASLLWLWSGRCNQCIFRACGEKGRKGKVQGGLGLQYLESRGRHWFIRSATGPMRQGSWRQLFREQGKTVCPHEWLKKTRQLTKCSAVVCFLCNDDSHLHWPNRSSCGDSLSGRIENFPRARWSYS